MIVFLQTVSGTIGAILTVELKDTIGWHGMFFLTGGMSIIGTYTYIYTSSFFLT